MGFKSIDSMKRLRELAGIEEPKDAGQLKDFEREADENDHGADETEGEHLDKEESVFQQVHDALEELLSFLQSQEGFEEKRGKEDEYSEMEHSAQELLDCMKNHLEGYDEHEDSDAGLHGEMPTGGTEPADMEDEQEEQWSVHHTGENTNKSIEQLHHELAAAKKRGDTTAIKQKEFAIRAKQKNKWGAVS